MFFKKNKIIIQSNIIPIDIVKNFLISFPYNMPKYFKNIPRHFENNGRIWKNNRTIKTCSGFINLFKRSLVFLSPFDIEIFIDNGLIEGSVGAAPLQNYFTVHPEYQFLKYVKSDYEVILKFIPHIIVKSDVSLIISNPWWHLNDFEIIPGVINAKETSELNVFIPIKKNQKHLYIKQNTPLCYINFETSKNVKLIYNNTKYNLSDNLGLFYSFSNLKRKLLKNILN